MDASNTEGMACLAAHHFYSDQPELALRFYRRLLQMGVSTAELWNNLGLCCFYASQYDMALSCLDRALSMATDESMADVWYNIGQVAIGIGDLGLAYQAFKISISVDSSHAESYADTLSGSNALADCRVARIRAASSSPFGGSRASRHAGRAHPRVFLSERSA